MRTIIFGAGRYGQFFYRYAKKNLPDLEIVGFVDNDAKNIRLSKDIPLNVYMPEELTNIKFEKIIISPKQKRAVKEIKRQVTKYAGGAELSALIEDPKLFYDFSLHTNFYSEDDFRVRWLKDFARYSKENELGGDIAECGVNRGDFSYYMGKYFPNKKLYLFDTFEGFADDDVKEEVGKYEGNAVLRDFIERDDIFVYNFDSAAMVKEKMPNSDNCVIRKGYFPDTAVDLNGQFCFVNLDMDIYVPMLAALKIFYPLMVDNGVILLHDYFGDRFPGVGQAIADYEIVCGERLRKFPVGDGVSIAIIK